MKKTFFSLCISTLLIYSLGSCQQSGCTVTNTNTGQIVADNNCNGTPDFQESGSTVSGTIVFYGTGIMRNVSGTSSIGYANDGIGRAITYDGSNNFSSSNVSTQMRLLSFQIPTAYGILQKEGIANQDLVGQLQGASGELVFTNLVVDAFDRKDVSAMQQYINSDQKIIVPEYVGEPETTQVWSSKGSNTYNHVNGQLNGRPVHYELIGYHLEYVRNVFRIQ